MPLRKGMTYPIYDLGPFTVSALSNWVCDGSHRWPKVTLIFRDRWMAGPSCTGGKALRYRRVSVPLPWIHWRWQRQHPVLRPLHTALSKTYWRAVKSYRRKTA